MNDITMRSNPCPYTFESLRLRRRRLIACGQPTRDPGEESDREFVEEWNRLYIEGTDCPSADDLYDDGCGTQDEASIYTGDLFSEPEEKAWYE